MIKWFKRLILLVFLVIAFVLGITFTSENSLTTAPILFGLQLPRLTLGMWLLIMLFIGAFIGLLLSFVPWFWGRRSVASRNKKIKQLEQELTQLRSLGIKD